MAGTSYKLRGIEPPDLARYPADVKKLFWSWVVELGIASKGKDILAGLDKDGSPLRAISAKTRKYRKSAMTPSGKGDPNAPALIPGWQKSRTYSLLAGRALTTHAEFYWRYDAWTGDQWGQVLRYQAQKGRDVIGLSPAGTARVKIAAWRKWELWKQGKVRQVAAVPRAAQRAGVPQVGRYQTANATFGMSAGGTAVDESTFKTGRWTGGMTPEEWAAYYRQTASARPPGRPGRPKAMSEISGPGYNRLIKATWNQGTGRGGGASAVAPKPRPVPRKPAPAVPRKPKEPEQPKIVRDFVTLVLLAVRNVPPDRLYGGRRAWIHDVWIQYGRLPGAEPLSLSAFKLRIVHEPALRMRMVRADLVQAFSRADIEASDTHYSVGGLGLVTFNFFTV